MEDNRPTLAAKIGKRCRLWTASLRTLPDFLILGAAKAGTSSLYALLCQHPQIAPATHKEIHYYDVQFDRGQRWYRSHFHLALDGPLHRLRRGKPILTGEASPYYLFHPHAARRIAQDTPHARLIALLRDPVARAYSHYQHNLRHGGEMLSFEEATAREPERIDGERQRMLADEAYNSDSFRLHSYLARGVYVDQLRAYHEHFPRKQLLVLKAEAFFADPRAEYLRALEFLGLDPVEPSAWTPLNQGNYARDDGPVFDRLRDSFRPHNRRLYDYLNVDFGW